MKKLPVGRGLNKGSSAQLSQKPVEIPLPPQLEQAKLLGAVEADLKAYRLGSCTVMVGTHPEHGWHLSIAHHKRYPTWQEVVTARYALIPDEAMMAMLLPSKQEYIDIHKFCFQLQEVKGWKG